MFRNLLVAGILCFVLSPGTRLAEAQSVTAAQKSPNQWALLIGVSDYQGEIQDLRFPGKDARAIKDLLVTSAGLAEDHVRLLTDDGLGESRATRQNIFAAIDQYLAPRVEPGHQIIIFLAGHGVVRGLGAQAKSYFLPVDTDPQTKESLERTAIDMEELAGKLSSLKASQFTIFFDACREDPFPGRGLKGNTLTDVTARLLIEVPTRPKSAQGDAPTGVIFYACRIGERAYENAQLGHGVFTYYILRGLRELADRPDGRVEAGQLAGYLRENVRKWAKEQAKTPVEQNPTMIATEVQGPVMIARITPLSEKLPATSNTSGVTMTTSPEGALLSINGQPAGQGPIHKEFAPGQYAIRAELPGFQPTETRINVMPGYQQEITVTLQPVAVNAGYERGLQLEKQNLWPQAIASYEQAMRDDPESMAVYERLAQVYLHNGRYREAIALLTNATRKFPGNAVFLARRSRARSAMAENVEPPPSASSSASNSSASDADGESGKKGGGKKNKAEGKGGKKDEAKEEKDDSEKLGKGGKGGKGGKKDKGNEGKDDSEIVAKQPAPTAGNTDAIRDAEAAIRIDGKLAAAHLALGFALLPDEKMQAKALDAFIRASTVSPDDAEAYFGVGYGYRLTRQFQQAIPQLKKAIDLRPDYYDAQRELAYCYHALGDTDEAIRHYQTASSYRGGMDDSSEMAGNNLALASLYKKKGDEIGGAEGEEYRKAGRAYESDARDHEPSLKGAVESLTAAGVSKLIENQLPTDLRKVLTEPKLPGKIKVKVKVPVKIPVKKLPW